MYLLQHYVPNLAQYCNKSINFFLFLQLAVVVAADSRRQLRDAIQASLDLLVAWAAEQKLTLSAPKTKIMVNRSPPPRLHHRDLAFQLYGHRMLEDLLQILGVDLDVTATIAFADDLLLVIEADGRRPLEVNQQPSPLSRRMVHQCKT